MGAGGFSSAWVMWSGAATTSSFSTPPVT
ncbi:hypothetical protein J2X01_000329 [Arthrobacter ginsengisoli]|uniref:Uncharacterized protein n=1 Tax=Arthrobacter ginsengisoli TaxID=1356565 RepID=A0ABU1U7D6_9MICC|nr:hypothetical protein [Arthrobacter ginsengisoli]